MKIRNLSFVLAGFALFTISIGAAHAEDKALRKQMEKWYRHAEKLFAEKDTDKLNSVFSPDFSSIGPTGEKINRDQMAAETISWFKTVKSISAKFKIQSVKQEGENVIVDSKYTFKSVSLPDAKGKSHKMTMRGSSIETWVKNGDGWLMTAYVEGPNSKMLMDGKPMNPNDMMPPKKD